MFFFPSLLLYCDGHINHPCFLKKVGKDLEQVVHNDSLEGESIENV